MKLSSCSIAIFFMIFLNLSYAEKNIEKGIYDNQLLDIDVILQGKEISSGKDMIKSLLNNAAILNDNEVLYLKFLLKRERIINDYTLENEIKFLSEVVTILEKENKIQKIVLLQTSLLESKQYYQFMKIYKLLKSDNKRIIKEDVVNKVLKK